MSEQRDVIADLVEAGVLDGLRWAYASAFRRLMNDYSSDTGHDQGWLGYTAHKLYVDRCDRAFSCGKYLLPRDLSEPNAGLDILYAGLIGPDIADIPDLPPGLVKRRDLNGSPGWGFSSYRWLLNSCAYGDIDEIRWKEKSQTKQRVAAQASPSEPTLFEGFGIPEVESVAELELDSAVSSLQTFVIAHAVDPISQKFQLVFGRPRGNDDGGPAWHWKEDLLTAPAKATGQKTRSVLPQISATDLAVPDAPVRLREHGEQQRQDQHKGMRS